MRWRGTVARTPQAGKPSRQGFLAQWGTDLVGEHEPGFLPSRPSHQALLKLAAAVFSQGRHRLVRQGDGSPGTGRLGRTQLLSALLCPAESSSDPQGGMGTVEYQVVPFESPAFSRSKTEGQGHFDVGAQPVLVGGGQEPLNLIVRERDDLFALDGNRLDQGGNVLLDEAPAVRHAQGSPEGGMNQADGIRGNALAPDLID